MIDYIDCVAPPIGIVPVGGCMWLQGHGELDYPSTTAGHTRFHNMHILPYKGVVHCRGSLTTYSRGHNAITLTFPQTVAAITDLEKQSGYGLDNWQLWRIEIGVCIELANPAGMYLPFLLSMPNKRRVIYEGESMYFRCKRQDFKFYDKTKELHDTFKLLQADWTGKHLMRVELNIKKSISEILGPLYLGDLKKPECFVKLLECFRKHFDSVRTPLCAGGVLPEGNLTAKQGFERLMGQILAQAEPNYVGGMLESMRKSMNSCDFSRLRKRMEHMQNFAFQNQGGLIDELKFKVQAECDRVLATCRD